MIVHRILQTRKKQASLRTPTALEAAATTMTTTTSRMMYA
jgi:hypothetical protein